MTNTNQPSSDGLFFDDPPSYSPNDSVAPVSEQGNLPESVVNAPTEKDSTPESAPIPGRRKVKEATVGSMWVDLVISAVLLVALLVFTLQNQQETALNLFGWTWNFPVGVGMLFAAILDVLIAVLIGGWRMFDLCRQIRKGDN